MKASTLFGGLPHPKRTAMPSVVVSANKFLTKTINLSKIGVFVYVLM